MITQKIIYEMLAAYSWQFVLAISFLEEIITPLPSSLVILLAGSMSPTPSSILWIVAIPSALGSSIGSLFIYYMARVFGEKGLKMVGVDVSDIHKIYEKYSGPAVFIILRAVPIIPFSVVSGLAGIYEYPVIHYLAFTFVGAIIRNYILGFVGFVLKESISAIYRKIEMLQIISAVLLVVLFVWILLKNEKVRKSIYQHLERAASFFSRL